MYVSHVSLALAALSCSTYINSFNPSNIQKRNPFFALHSSTLEDTDVKIPYDAAAMLEYDAWRREYNKGDFVASRFDIFKKNYEMVTIENVKTAKQVREGKVSEYALIGLNEYADMTEEEFLASRSRTFQILPPEASRDVKEDIPISTKAKASDIDSVEDLEKVLDGIDKLENDTTRMRAAYLDWCKQFSKESDESRFKTFSKNYLQFETYYKEIDIPLLLNEYADLTPEEYKKINLEVSESKIKGSDVKEEVEEEKEPGYLENIIDTEAISSVYQKAVDVVKAVELTIPEPKIEEPVKAEETKIASNETIVIEENTLETSVISEEKSEEIDEPVETEDVSPLKIEDKVNDSEEESIEEVKVEFDEVIIGDKNVTTDKVNKSERESIEEVKVESTEEIAEGRNISISPESVPEKKETVAPPENKEPGYLDNIIDTKAISSVFNKTVKAFTPVIPPKSVSKEKEVPPENEEPGYLDNIIDTEAISSVLNKTVQAFTPVITSPTLVIGEKVDQKVVSSGTLVINQTSPKEPSADQYTGTLVINKTSKPRSKVDEEMIPPIIKKDSKSDTLKKSYPPRPITPKPPAKPSPKVETEVGDAVTDAFSSLFGLKSKAKESPKAKFIPKKEIAPKVIPKRKEITSSSTKTLIPNTNSTFSFFSPKKKTQTPAKEPTADVKSTDTPPKSQASFSFFGTKEDKKPDPIPAAEPKVPPKEQSKEVFSFFSPKPTSKPVASDNMEEVEKITKATPLFSIGKSAPANKVPDTNKEDTKKQDAKPDFLSTLFKSDSKSTTIKKDAKPIVSKKDTTPPPVASTANVTSSNTVSDVFGTLFGAPKQNVKNAKPAVVSKAPTPAESEPTPSKSSFSLFSKPAKKKAEPIEESVPDASKDQPKKAAFSFFVSQPKKEEVVTETPPPAPVVKEKKQSFSFFSTPKPKTVEPAPVDAPTPTPVKKKATPMFSFGISKTPAKTPQSTPVPKPAVKKSPSIAVPNTRASGTFSISKALRNGMKTSIATITDFNQNQDGSITGKVYNAKNFRDGTTITTSPVPKNAKSGTIVTTSSGTKYQLK